MNPDPDLATLTVWQNNRQNVASYLNSTACSNYFNNNAQLKDLYPLLKSAIAGNTDTFWDGSRSTISTYDAGFWGPDDTEAEKTTMKTYTVCRTMIGGSGIAASTDIHGPNIYVNPYYRNHHYSDGYNPFNQSTLLHETLHTLGKTDCDLQKAMGDTCDRSNTTGISKHLLTAGCSAN